jgi:hypothetical protein
MGLMRSSYVRSMAFQSANKFLPGSRWLHGSLLFVASKFGDLRLQDPESQEIAKLGTGHIPPALVRVSLVNETKLRHRSISLGKTDLDPAGDKADHILIITTAITDSISQSLLKSDFVGDREIFMVGDEEQPPRENH